MPAPTPCSGNVRNVFHASCMRMRRASRDPVASLLSSVMLATRSQYDDGASGSARTSSSAAPAAIAGLRLTTWTPSIEKITASPTKPPREYDTITAQTIRKPRNDALSRPSVVFARIATRTVRGRSATMFSARSFGFWNIPPTAPCTRPFSTRLKPRA